MSARSQSKGGGGGVTREEGGHPPALSHPPVSSLALNRPVSSVFS